MKNSLGRAFLILLTLLHVEIFASTYEWSVKANKTTAYVNEAIHLTYTCKFSDRGELYTIDFNAVGVDYSSNFNYYTDPSGKLVLTYTGGITYSGSYSLLTFKLRIKDANGNGDSYIDGSGNFFINFTVKITN